MTSDLTTLEANRQAAGPRPTRRLGPVLTVAGIAAVAAIAVGLTAITTSNNGSAPKPDLPASQVSTSAPGTSAPSTSAAGTSAAGTSAPGTAATPTSGASRPVSALLKNGAQQGRAQVPWDQVGPGWTLALWTPSTTLDKNSQGAVLRNVPESVFLVNPVGGRYLITTLPVGHHLQLEQWSGDGQRASFTRVVPNSETTTSTNVELNLGTGAWHEISVSGRAHFSYTKPLGLALLVSRDSGLERVGPDGSRQLLYPASYPGIGKVSGGYYTPDGSQLVRNTDQGWVVITNDGTVVRTLSRPTGMTHCYNERWWTATTILMTCYPGLPDGHPTLWLVPVTGAAVTPLLTPQAGSGVFFTAIRVGSQTLLEGGNLDGDFHCDGTDLFVLLPDGETRALNFRKRTGTSQGIHFLQATRQMLYLTTNLPCGQDQQILRYDPRTEAFSTLLGGSVNGGTIIQALGYRAIDPPR